MISIDHGGKVALVTGSGAGIGREIARWLAEAGAHVVVNDIRGDDADAVVTEIADAGGSAEAVIADLRDDDAVDAMVEGIVERHGRLDIAVNNVGMYPPGRMPKPFTAGRGDDYREIFDQNLVLAALCGRAEAEAMGETGGVILFVSSGETTRPAPFTSIYAAAKAGLNHLVTSMAPGTTRTEMVAAAYTEERFAEIAQSTPLRYAVEHDELARLAVFLTSDLARAITGQMILADAGAFLSRTRPENQRPKS